MSLLRLDNHDGPHLKIAFRGIERHHHNGKLRTEYNPS